MTVEELFEGLEADESLSLVECMEMSLEFHTSETQSFKVLSVYATEGVINIDLEAISPKGNQYAQT